MSIWEKIIAQDFAIEKEIEITRFFNPEITQGKKIYLTVREIDGITAKTLSGFEGRIMTAVGSALITQFTHEYDLRQAENWKLKFEHGIHPSKHNLEEVFGPGFKLSLPFWEECASNFPALFKAVEAEIDKINFPAEPSDAKKKKSALSKPQSNG